MVVVVVVRAVVRVVRSRHYCETVIKMLGRLGGGVDEIISVVDEVVEVCVFVGRADIVGKGPGGVVREVVDLRLGGFVCISSRGIGRGSIHGGNMDGTSVLV